MKSNNAPLPGQGKGREPIQTTKEENTMREIGIITVEEFKQAVKTFGFESPVVTAIWNTMEQNPNNQEEFETIYALWSTGKFD